MLEGNLIIKASAGTGKTFSLATRFIRLMLFDRVAPEKIIALTFSRAAAQEIYTKILERLWKAASGDAGAQAEKRNLLDRLPDDKLAMVEAQNIDWSAQAFARLLRQLINTQHKGAISTLDSFILRIVSNFPQEFGFQNAVEVLDEFGENAALDAAVADMVADDKVAAEVRECISTAKDNAFSRKCLDLIHGILIGGNWRNFVLSNRGCESWTVESMAAALEVDLHSEPPDLGFFDDFPRSDPVHGFCRHVQTFTPEGKFFPSDKPRALMESMMANPQATAFVWTTKGGDDITYEYGPDGARLIRDGVRHLVNRYLSRQLAIVVAKIRLVSLVEREYHLRTRRQGKLTFQDFTDYSAAQEGSAGAIALQNLEFRFDARFDHWALDEFQDTSEAQWCCLNRLVRSAASGGGGRSVLAVGDQKQSIYAWRGASQRPFEELLSWPEFSVPHGKVDSIDRSYRYGRVTANFVNRVFGPTNDLIDEPDWCSEWPEHQARSDNDYVKVVAAAPDVEANVDDAILPALYYELLPVWTEHEARHSGETIGILVRGNAHGMMVANYLRSKGLPVVWEGMSCVHDLPAVQAVLGLLRLAVHPEDTLAWKTIDVLLPKMKLLLPDCTSAAKLSAKVAAMLSQQGLARTMKDFCVRLAEDDLGLDELSRERLAAVVRMAVDYEQRPSSDGGVDGFIDFLEQAQRRELGVSSGVIRILTIHRSKGLTLDRVFVPLFECKGDGAQKDGRGTAAIDRPKMSAPLFVQGEPWVLPHLTKGVEQLNRHTKQAYETMCWDRLLENLRTYYVAFTRARRATYVVFPQDSNADIEKGLLVRDLVINAFRGFERRALMADGAEYGRLVYEEGTPPALKEGGALPEQMEAWQLGPGMAEPKRSTPSGAIAHGLGSVPVAALFSSDYGTAVERGTETHARLAAIEWATAAELAELPPAFHEAFTPPSPDAVVWRERPYELLHGDEWESGQFDRVVFTGEGDSRRAVIYDFKTNALRAGESGAEFAERMRRLYAGQLAAYRRALAMLTGLSPERISTVLLLTATAEACTVACPLTI